jgi:Spy/CpxP family protein refolding chaperone
MLALKLAARRQIRPLLTPDQQKLLDQDVANIAKGGKAGGGKKGTAPAREPAFEDQESLSAALMNYAALTAEEKKAIIVRVKRGARVDASLRLTAEQQAKLDSDITALSKE